ncbi:MAG: hypothetical protein ACOC4M_18140 [Promethearchaeia archaeon]
MTEKYKIIYENGKKEILTKKEIMEREQAHRGDLSTWEDVRSYLEDNGIKLIKREFKEFEMKIKLDKEVNINDLTNLVVDAVTELDYGECVNYKIHAIETCEECGATLIQDNRFLDLVCPNCDLPTMKEEDPEGSKEKREISLSERFLLLRHHSAIIKPFDPELKGLDWNRPVTITIEQKQKDITPMCKHCKGFERCGGATWGEYFEAMWMGFVWYMNYLRLRYHGDPHLEYQDWLKVKDYE